MGYWIIDGRQLTDEQYNELQRQKRLEKQKIQEESNRLSRQLGAAYAALKGHLRRHEGTSQQVADDRAQDQHIYQKLRQNLERADEAPRCGTVREDGTWCRSPRLKNSVHCYAHYRMKQAEAATLQLAAVADPNAIQMAIMQVQKWLIDDEISEKKAGLLLYSLQLAATNVGKTTFGQAKDEDLAEEVGEVEEVIQMERRRVEDEKRLEEIRKTLPLTNTDGTDRKTGEQDLPRMNADEHGSGIGEQGLPLIHTEDTDRKNLEEELPRMDADERGSGIGEQGLPLTNTDDTDQDGLGKILPQSAGGNGSAGGAEAYANRGASAEVHANLG
jgi:hypothetical protein